MQTLRVLWVYTSWRAGQDAITTAGLLKESQGFSEEKERYTHLNAKSSKE